MSFKEKEITQEKSSKLSSILKFTIISQMIKISERTSQLSFKTTDQINQEGQVDLVVLAARTDIHNSLQEDKTNLWMNSGTELILILPLHYMVLRILYLKLLVTSSLERVRIFCNLNFIIKSIKTKDFKIHLENHSESLKEERLWKLSLQQWLMLSKFFKEIQIFQLIQLVMMS